MSDLNDFAEIIELAKDKGVKLAGIENIPELRQGNLCFAYDGAVYQEDRLINIACFDDGNVSGLEPVSDNYKLVQHKDIVSKALLELIENRPEFELESVNVHILRNGGKMLAEFNSGYEFDINGKGDIIKPKTVIINSADKTASLSLKAGAWRLICSNGMEIIDTRIEQIKSSGKHSGSLSMSGLFNKFMIQFENLSDSIGMFSDFARIELSKESYVQVLENLGMKEKRIETIMETPLIGDGKSVADYLSTGKVTGWDAYNSLTQFVSHSELKEESKLTRGIEVTREFQALVN